METQLVKRITIKLDDDVYEALLKQAGGERKVSETLNPILRQGLNLPQPPEVLEKIEELGRQLSALREQVLGRKEDQAPDTDKE